MKDLNKHDVCIKEVVDSFRKLCDYIEIEVGCGKCPVYNECFCKDKHLNLDSLMTELDMEVSFEHGKKK